MRGDRPVHPAYRAIGARFTPHARGSTMIAALAAGDYKVYPACAGIDLGDDYVYSDTDCLPRMRGDRPCIGFL